MLVAGGLCYGRLSDDGKSFVSRKVHRLLRVPPTGSSASRDWTCNEAGLRPHLPETVADGPDGCLRAVTDRQFAEQILHVLLDRLDADLERVGDLLIGEPH